MGGRGVSGPDLRVGVEVRGKWKIGGGGAGGVEDRGES